MDIETLATFFGWCAVINFGAIVFVFAFIRVYHEWFGKLGARFFGVSQEDAKAAFFRVFLQLRLAFFVLNLVPFVALKIMTQT